MTSATPAMFFRPIYDLSDGADGFVDRVAPYLARNDEGTREAARRLWKTSTARTHGESLGTIEGALEPLGNAG